MSQEKVERYKEYKKNKDKILKREKLIRRLELSGAALVCVALIGWVGYSLYDNAVTAELENREQTVTEIDTASLSDYLNGLTTEDVDTSVE